MRYAVDRRTAVLALALTLALTGAAAAADWPQFQGPTRDGVSPETDLARSWPEDRPKELWSVRVGAGYAGPAVRDGEVYLLDRERERSDVLRCFDLVNGEEKWRYEYDAPGSTGHSGSRTTPTVDADCVYTVGLMGDFVCVDRKTHKPLWHKNLLEDYGVSTPNWGCAQSPVLYNDLVIVAPQSDTAFVAAYKRETGEVVWESPDLGGLGYSPPVVASLCGADQVVMVSASEGEGTSVWGLSIEDGAPLWSYHGWHCRIPIPYATALPGDRLFITGGYDAGSVMLQITREGGAYGMRECFTLDPEQCGSQIHQPIFYKNHLYVNSNSNERELGLMCLTLDGKILWRTKDNPDYPTFERGNLLLAGDLLLALHGKRKTLHLIDPSPEGYKELASARVIGTPRAWSPMALSDGKLLVRDWNHMKCLDVRNP